MKKDIAITLLWLLGLCLVSQHSNANNWRTEDTYAQAAYLTLHVIDWGQTRAMVAGDCKRDHLCHELNPILGKMPSLKDVDRYFVVTAVVHTVVAYHLPQKWRTRFQYMTIGMQVVVVGHNRANGLGINFRF